MIHAVADLLQDLASREADLLFSYKIDHPPTIGAMYEGLTTKVLTAAVPEELDLKVVSGFITSGQGRISAEIDCMVVNGSGERVPNTTKFKWPAQDVLAIVEVKKTLHSSGMIEAYANLANARDVFSSHMQDPNRVADPLDVTPVYDAFHGITGVSVSTWDEAEALPPTLRLMLHTLISEFVSPVRVMFGYQGFASENSFRRAFAAFLTEHQGARGYGVLSLPQLCVSNGYSLVKLNGMPIYAPLEAEWWPVVASSASNPLRFLIALLWARIEHFIGVPMPWDSLDLEHAFTKFIYAKAIEHERGVAWHLKGYQMQ